MNFSEIGRVTWFTLRLVALIMAGATSLTVWWELRLPSALRLPACWRLWFRSVSMPRLVARFWWLMSSIRIRFRISGEATSTMWRNLCLTMTACTSSRTSAMSVVWSMKARTSTCTSLRSSKSEVQKPIASCGLEAVFAFAILPPLLIAIKWSSSIDI